MAKAQWNRPVRFFGLLGAAVLSMTMFGAGTSAAAIPQDPQAEYCVTTLKKLQPDEATSEVVSRKCGSGAEFVAENTSVDTILLWLYTDIEFKGHYEVYLGSDGPCDSTGYGINHVGLAMNNAASSLTTGSYCNGVTLYNYTNRDKSGGFFNLAKDRNQEFNSWPSLPQFNDVTSSVHLLRW